MEEDKAVEQSSTIDKSLKTREDNARRSISNITEAIVTVVSHSTNDEFRQTCFSLMKVSNSSGLASAVSSKLKSVAHQHLGVALPPETPIQRGQPSEAVILNNSQPPSSFLEDQDLTSSHSTDSSDFDVDFSDVDFFDDKDDNHQIPSQSASAAATLLSMKAATSAEVLKSSSTEEDWFDKVLDSDLFFNEG